VILIAVASRHRSLLHETVNQFHHAVMAKAEPVREGCDRGAGFFGQAFDGEEKLVLLRFNVTGASGFFAEVQELADAVTEFRKLAITCLGNISVHFSRANVAIAGNHLD
jgi:hypothetical protein